MKKAPGRLALTALAAILLLSGTVLALFFLPPFPQARGMLDQLAADGSLESFSAGLHARLRPLGALGALLFLAGAAALLFRARLLVRFGPFWSGLVGRWRADARNLREPAKARPDGWWLLLLALAGGLANGLYLDQPMSHDESYTVMVFASRNLLSAVSDYHLPNNHVLHTVLAHFSMRLLGDAPWSARLPAFLAYVALIPAGYLAGRRLFGRRAGLLAAALTAALPVFRIYAANARGYTLLALFAVLALALAARVKARDNRVAWLLMALVFALGFWTLPVMLFPFGMIMTWLLLSWLARDIGGADRRAFLLHWLFCGATAALLTLLLYMPVFIYSGFDALFGNSFVTPESWNTLFANLFVRLGVTFRQWSAGMPVIFALVLAAAVLGALIFHRRLSTDRVPFLLAGMAWVFTQAVVERVAPQPRFWFFLLPFFLIYAGAGLAALVERLAPPRAAILTGAAAVLIAALGLYAAISAAVAHPPSAPGTNERLISYLLDGTLQPGDKVIADDEAPTLWYYAMRAGLDPRILTHATEDPFDRALVLVNESLGQTLQSVLKNTGVEAHVDPSTAILLGQVDRTLIYALSPKTP